MAKKEVEKKEELKEEKKNKNVISGKDNPIK